jgi:MFS family permease
MMLRAPGEGGAVEPREPSQPSQLSQRRTLIIIGALLLGMLLAALDQTIVATALPTIAGDLHGLSHLSWVVTAYLLASTVSTPLWASWATCTAARRSSKPRSSSSSSGRRSPGWPTRCSS